MDRLWYALAAISALAGAVLVVRGLFLDRARGRRRCPKCWYDMSAQAERSILICPECGRDARSVRRLGRTRRRRRPALLGMLLVLLAASGFHWLRVREDVANRGWIAAIPSVLLVLFTPIPDDPTHRTHFSTFTEWQAESLTRMYREPWPWYRLWQWRFRRATTRRGLYGMAPHDRKLIEHMMSGRIESLSGNHTVSECFDWFSRQIGARVVVDWVTLERWGIARESTVYLTDNRGIQRSPADILEDMFLHIVGPTERDLSPNLVFDQYTSPLSWNIVDGTLHIERHGDHAQPMSFVLYRVDTLVDYEYWHESLQPSPTEIEFSENPEPIENVREVISTFVDPNFLDWDFGTLIGFWLFERSILIRTTNRNHYEIRQLLDELERRIPRDARGNFVLPTDPRRVRVE